MTFHPEQIVTDAQTQFQQMLSYATGPAAQRQTADEAERALFRHVLALGRTLLGLFFAHRAAVRPPAPRAADGTPLAYHDRRPRAYVSVFGPLTLRRHAFTAPGQPVVCPLDAALGLPTRCYSDLLTEWAAFGSTDACYRETQALLGRILDLPLTVAALETLTTEAAADAAAFVAQPPDPAAPAPAGPILVAQSDGKGVPMVQPPAATRPLRLGKGQKRTKKKEAITTALYTVAPYPRAPADVLAALFPDPAQPPPAARPAPIGKEVRATLAGKAAAVRALAARAGPREGSHIRHRVALTDGAEALQQQMRAQLPDYTLVLDILHVAEHLWATANVLLGEAHVGRAGWVRARLHRVLAGQAAAVIAECDQVAAQPRLAKAKRAAAGRLRDYFARNLAFMRYDEYLAQGWPIGTGVVEGACGHLVKDRMERAGMRWTEAGAQAVLNLRAIRLNGEWDDYWPFHRRQDRARRYGPAAIPPPPAELQALAVAA